MAWTAHKNEGDVVETFDEPAVFQEKVKKLAEMVSRSKHFVIFTGAGVSTSAGIPDFRGPQGVWTLKAKNEARTLPTVSTIKAVPTPCHMSIVKLQKEGICKFLITQNCDGLHRRSGVHVEKIAELHGNGNVEECERCGKQYFRDFKAYRLVRSRDHFTGRYCVVPNCGGKLMEWTIDFGQNLPESCITRGYDNAVKADLHLVLGSSLTVSPACDMPKKTKKLGGKLVIVNLQKTPLDSICDIKIHAKCDDVMLALLKLLNLELPQWKLKRRFIVDKTMSTTGKTNIFIQALDTDDDNLPATIFKSIEVQQPEPLHNERLKQVKKAPFNVTLEDPAFRITGNIGHRAEKIQIKFNFMQHYNEPPLIIEELLEAEEVVERKQYKIYYSIYTQQWESKYKMLSTNRPTVTQHDGDDDDVVELNDNEMEKLATVSIEKHSDSEEIGSLWATSVVCEDKNGTSYVLHAGGAGGAGDLLLYNIETKQWSKINSISSNSKSLPFISARRWAHASCVVPDISKSIAYFFGGWDNQCQYSDIHCYDLSTNQFRSIESSNGKGPSPRGGLSATPYKNGVFIFGGTRCVGGPYEYYNDLYYFNAQTNSWTKIDYSGTPPSPRSQHCAALIKEQTLLVIGGYNGSEVLSDAYTFDISSSTWSAFKFKGTIPTGLRGLTQEQYRVYPATFSLFHFYDNKVITVGLGKGRGRENTDNLGIYVIDLETGRCTVPETESTDPDALNTVSIATSGCCLNSKDVRLFLGSKSSQTGNSSMRGSVWMLKPHN